MKRFSLHGLLLILGSLIVAFSVSAQSEVYHFDGSNAEVIELLTIYRPDARGLWHKNSNIEVTEFNASLRILAKSNKFQTLYGCNENQIVKIILTKQAYTAYKKDKLIPEDKKISLLDIVDAESKALENKFENINQKRTKFLIDSIAEVNRRQAEEKARIEAEKKRLAEIEKCRQDSIQKEEFLKQQAIDDAEYKKKSSFKRLELGSYSGKLQCDVEDCDYKHDENYIENPKILDDHIVFDERKYGIFDVPYTVTHAIPINNTLRKEKDIERFLRVWGDTITIKPDKTLSEYIELRNTNGMLQLVNGVRKKAPNGFIKEYSWDNEYGPVTLDITYENTNSKTIKYIKFFFTVYNDVDDVRGTGAVQGTGPVYELNSGRWDFDYTSCWPAGDASYLKITKIVITYMNGSVATLTGSKILNMDD